MLSGSTALIGGVLGAVLSYLIVSMGPRSLIRRTTLAITGVLAQFGGVVLAFAWLSVLGFSGLLTVALKEWPGIDIVGSGWLYGLNGLIVVYTYFQVPLMVLVFTPALEGLRPQLREAAVNLGATSFQYWRMVGIPLLFPAFLGSMLLLFANAFAAYATAAVLVSQGSPIVPLLIKASLTSEILLGQQNLAFALAAEMIVVVAIVMGALRAVAPPYVEVAAMIQSTGSGSSGPCSGGVRASTSSCRSTRCSTSASTARGVAGSLTFEYYKELFRDEDLRRRSSPRCCWPC